MYGTVEVDSGPLPPLDDARIFPTSDTQTHAINGESESLMGRTRQAIKGSILEDRLHLIIMGVSGVQDGGYTWHGRWDNDTLFVSLR